MKKISVLLLLAMLFSVTLVSCKTGEEKNEKSRTAGESVTTTTSDDSNIDTPPEDGNKTKFKVDGDLSDWKDIKSISLVGNTEQTKEKSVTFYASTSPEGLYIACEVKHDVYSFGKNAWWENSNLEFFINSGRDNQYYVYAAGMESECKFSSNVDSAKMVTKKLSDQGTEYHTTVEAFVSLDNIPGKSIPDGVLNVGVAWKTVGDKIAGGEANKGDEDEYWVPAGSWPDNDDQAIVKEDGIYLKAEINANDAGNGDRSDNNSGSDNGDSKSGDTRSKLTGIENLKNK